jgi:hypothetical protein
MDVQVLQYSKCEVKIMAIPLLALLAKSLAENPSIFPSIHRRRSEAAQDRGSTNTSVKQSRLFLLGSF